MADPELGPTTVDAGTCARCDLRPRVVATCGPVAWSALCRTCAGEVGPAGWCDGHADDAADLLRRLEELPSWWGDAVVLWWVATGEVSWDGRAPAVLPDRVLDALPPGGHQHYRPGDPTRTDTP